MKIMFGLSLRSGAASAASVVPSGFAPSFPPCPPGSRRFKFSSETGFPPSVFPVYHPGLASCSARLLFVWFMVRISFRFVFSSARFVSFRSLGLSSSSLLVPARFQISFVCSVLSSFYALCPLTGDLFILFSRILYTSGMDFQMYFLPENMSFLRIVRIIDIKAKFFDAFRYSFRSSKNDKNDKRTSVFCRSPDRLRKSSATLRLLADADNVLFPANNKKHMPGHDTATGIERDKEVNNITQIQKNKNFYILKFIFLFLLTRFSYFPPKKQPRNRKPTFSRCLSLFPLHRSLQNTGLSQKQNNKIFRSHKSYKKFLLHLFS